MSMSQGLSCPVHNVMWATEAVVAICSGNLKPTADLCNHHSCRNRYCRTPYMSSHKISDSPAVKILILTHLQALLPALCPLQASAQESLSAYPAHAPMSCLSQ